MKAKHSDSSASLRWLFLILGAVPLALAFHISCSYAADVDEDGLDDDLVEQYLINAYRPFLKYDSEETHWPSSVTWKVRHSELLYDTDDNLIYTIDQLNANPTLILEANFNGYSSSTEDYPVDKSAYRLNIYDQFRTGSWPRGEEPLEVGMYARVVPLVGPITCNNYPDLSGLVLSGDLLIQYYQFFPFNDYKNAPDPFGNHEGDWLILDVYVAGTSPYPLRAIIYHHHGDGECFPTKLTGSGLPSDGVPVCYLERGAHEWWPTTSDSGCTWSASHDGNGPNVQAQNVLNLGEHFAPMNSDEAKMIAFYNGAWGYGTAGMANSPPGPLSLGSDRCFCVQAPRFVAYVRRYGNVEPPRDEVKATKYYPVLAVSAGVDIVQTNGHVRIFPGSYPEAMTLTKPMTLEAWGPGIVTIDP
jgi:hypothetical protein